VAQAADGSAEVLDLETSPVGTEVLRPQGGVLTHANHFHRSDALGIWEPLQEERTSTFERQRRIDDLLAPVRTGRERVDREAVMAFLQDHRDAPRSLCRHPEPHLPEVQRYQTVVSALLEPGEGRLWLAAGPPCETPFEEYRLGS
jgi:isopenicillin-N N-acyltransferase-like protein